MGARTQIRAEDQGTVRRAIFLLNNNQSCLSTPTGLGFQMPAIFLLAQRGLMAAIIITQTQGPALVPLSQKRPCLLSMQLTSQSRCVFTLSTPHSFPRHGLPCRSLAHHKLHIHVHLSCHMCLTAPPHLMPHKLWPSHCEHAHIHSGGTKA